MSEVSPELVTAYEQQLAAMADSFALSMSEELNHMVRVEPPTVTVRPVDEMLAEAPQVLQTAFSFGATGPDEGLLVFSETDAPLIARTADGVVGGKPPVGVDDEQMNRLAEVMSGIVQGFGAVIGTALNKAAHPGPVATSVDRLALPPSFAVSGTAVDARFEYEIDGVLEGTFHMIVTPDMVLQFATDDADAAPAPTAAQAGPASAFTAVDGGPAPMPAAAPFHQIESYAAPTDALPRGVDLILDIPLELTVELGRVRMLIKDVLELTSGSIVELDRLAGEPIDLLVNGRLVAKGEVVVIDDNFGVRVTEIVNQADRIAGLGRR